MMNLFIQIVELIPFQQIQQPPQHYRTTTLIQSNLMILPQCQA